MKKIREFPEKIRLVVTDSKTHQDVEINLKKKPPAKALAGVSQKTVYEDEKGCIYFVKAQKPRSIINIVASQSPQVKNAFEQIASLAKKIGLGIDEYSGKPFVLSSDKDAKIEFVSAEKEESLVKTLRKTEQNNYRRHQKEIAKAAEHVISMLIERSFLEALSPLIVTAIMGDSICVPKNYLFLTEEKDALILSKSVTDHKKKLVEFLSERSVVKGKTTPHDWQELPLTEDLELTGDEAYILGQLYATGLLIGHWDLFNNIDLSNSGYIESVSGKKAAIIDHGNDFFTGFEGGLKEQSAAQNPDLTGIDFSEFKQTAKTIEQLTGKQYTSIFDTQISLLHMPRLLVPNLFNITSEGEDDHLKDIRAQQFRGFKDACKQAQKNLDKIQTSIPHAISTMFTDFMSAKDAKIVAGIINQDIYHLRKGDSTSYNFANVMYGRINSLQEILAKLSKSGTKLSQVSQDCFRQMYQSQRFFAAKPKTTPGIDRITATTKSIT